LVNSEKKFHDTNQDTSISNTSTIVPISLMDQGDDWNQRNGRRVKAQSVYLNGQITINPSATRTNFRCVIFWDRNPNGANVTASALMAVADDLQSPLNKSNAGSRFVVIYDRYFDLSINGVETRTVRVYRKLYHHVNYLGPGDTTGNLGPGNIFMLLLSNEATNTPVFHYYIRFSYTDN